MPNNIAEAVLRRFAPAKINLYLHVTGQRASGYHELDSLVAFASVGDQVEVSAAADLTLEVTGPEASALTQTKTNDNLVMRAARLLAERYSVSAGARIVLQKNLPVASGIGGGSADAAAVLKALVSLWALEATSEALAEIGLTLGADVPVCLTGRPQRMTGIGERLHETPPLPDCHLVLVNPRSGLSTPDVFAALHKGSWRPRGVAAPMPADSDFLSFVAELKKRGNDLEEPAIELLPGVRDVLAALQEQKGCRLARMSGSGATCFGLFAMASSAEDAASAIREISPGWWVKTGRLGDHLPDLRQAYAG